MTNGIIVAKPPGAETPSGLCSKSTFSRKANMAYANSNTSARAAGSPSIVAAFGAVGSQTHNTQDSEVLTMSSREIAELTDKELSHVHRDIRAMLDALKDDPVLDHVREDRDVRGYTAAFHLSRELTYTLLTGYSVPLRRRVIARWQELEAKVARPALPDFTDPAAAARAWAEQYEAKKQAEQQLALAAPKVEFVDRFVAASSGSKGFREVAKLLGANEARFREFLMAERVMYRLGRSLMPYQNHLDAGRFEVKAGVANEHAYNRCLFTPKGVEWIAGEWAKFQVRGGIAA